MTEFNELMIQASDLNNEYKLKIKEKWELMVKIDNEIHILQKKIRDVNEKMKPFQQEEQRKIAYRKMFNSKKRELDYAKKPDKLLSNDPAQLHEAWSSTGRHDETTDDDEQDLEVYHKFRFGDVVDLTGNRHYGYTFHGNYNETTGMYDRLNSEREEAIDQEFGLTVPISVSRMHNDNLFKYCNFKHVIVAYELPYYDVTVEIYRKVYGDEFEFENKIFEYIMNFETDEWEFRVIDDEKNEITLPKI